MTALAGILAARITAEGPISLADYMAECLLHPAHGYYATHDPLGVHGDFTTAPEISQMFGEMLGLCLAQAWLDQGSPVPFALAELGPGRGTLMADILRTIRAAPGMYEAAQIHLVEASDVLRAAQAQSLAGQNVTWHPIAADLPDMPLFLVANEFFDALPIRQFQRAPGGWRECMVGLDPEGRLTPDLAPASPYAVLAHRLEDTKPGDKVELCPGLASITAEIASRVAGHGGVALIVDYGGWHSLGDTFQALRNHAPTDPFAAPGAADLTAHVDFEAIAIAARSAGAAPTPLVPQGVFLERLGITARAQRLAKGLEGDGLASHSAAHRRMTHPEEMGTLFMVLGLHPKAAPPPQGLEPAGPP